VHELKYVVIMIAIVMAFMCLTAQAQEREPLLDLPKGGRWELTIVSGHDLVDLAFFDVRLNCIKTGILYVKNVETINGFICEQEFK